MAQACHDAVVSVNHEPATPEPTRVLVVDDQELFRRGLTMLLAAEDGIEVVGEAGDGIEGVALATSTAPDVVLLDVRMPKRSGIEACQEIKEAVPAAKIIMLTSSDEEADLYEAVKSGASGYLLKDSSIDEVAQAIRVVADGQSLISPSMAVKLIDEFKQMSRPDRSAVPGLRLTERELEVLRLVAKGMNNREIAKQLFISENTVKNHVRNLLEKLQLHSRMEAVMYAVREKLLDLPVSSDRCRRRSLVSRAVVTTLSTSQARRIALAAQGFLDKPHDQPTMRTFDPHRRAHRRAPGRLGQRAPAGALHAAVLPDGGLRRRPARPGAVGARKPRRLVEYWAHVQALMPVELWPVMRHRMDSYRTQKHKWWGSEVSEELVANLMAEIADRGACTARDLDDGLPRDKKHWGWNWSATKRALDYLYMTGEVAIAGRNSQFEVRYDLPERVLPADVLAAPTPTLEEANLELVRRAARSHGVATVRCLADYYRTPPGAGDRAAVRPSSSRRASSSRCGSRAGTGRRTSTATPAGRAASTRGPC